MKITIPATYRYGDLVKETEMIICGKKVQKDFYLSRDQNTIKIGHIPSGLCVLSFKNGRLSAPGLDGKIKSYKFSNKQIRHIANRLREVADLFPQSWQEGREMLNDWEEPRHTVLRENIIKILY